MSTDPSSTAAADTATGRPPELPATATPRKGVMVLLGIFGVMLLLGLPVLLRLFVIEAFKIPAGSMIPTLVVGDHIFVKKFAYSASHPPARGDIVVFTFPKDERKDFIKRIAAVGGDTIQVCDESVLLNGQKLRQTKAEGSCEYEDFDEERGEAQRISCTRYTEQNGEHSYDIVQNGPDRLVKPGCTETFSVPAGHVFVLGDNRDNSYDSRFWGTVPVSLVKGEAWRVWWSGGKNLHRFWKQLE